MHVLCFYSIFYLSSLFPPFCPFNSNIILFEKNECPVSLRTRASESQSARIPGGMVQLVSDQNHVGYCSRIRPAASLLVQAL